MTFNQICMTNSLVKGWRAPVSSSCPFCKVWILQEGIQFCTCSCVSRNHSRKISNMIWSFRPPTLWQMNLSYCRQYKVDWNTSAKHLLKFTTRQDMHFRIFCQNVPWSTCYQLVPRDGRINLRPKTAKNQEIGILEKSLLVFSILFDISFSLSTNVSVCIAKGVNMLFIVSFVYVRDSTGRN